MRTFFATAALLLSAPLFSCSVAVETEIATPQTVSAGCGACTYQIEGAEGCPLAVEIDGKPMLVTGSDFNAMDNGLCAEKAQLEVVGEVQGDKFAASSVKLAN